MNKKTLIILIIGFTVLGLILFFAGKMSKPEQPLKEVISASLEEIRLLHEELWRGEISQEEAGERLDVLDNKIAELINRHGIEVEVNEFISQQKTTEELVKQTDLQIRTIGLRLAGIAKTDTDLAASLMQEFSGIRNEVYAGQVSPEKAEEKISVFENKLTELIVQYGIETEIDELVAQRKAIEELWQWAEPRIDIVEIQLGGIANYFARKHGADKETERRQAMDLQADVRDFGSEIIRSEISREEIEEKLSFFENKTAELIKEYGIETEIDDFAERIDGSVDRVTEISQRISDIQLKLTALELYLSDNF